MTLLTSAGPGRPKGSKNKATQFAAKYLNDNGFNVLQRLMDLCNDPKSNNKEKLMALKILADKTLPSLKAVELSGELDTSTPVVTLSDLSEGELDALENALKKAVSGEPSED